MRNQKEVSEPKYTPTSDIGDFTHVPISTVAALADMPLPPCRAHAPLLRVRTPIEALQQRAFKETGEWTRAVNIQEKPLLPIDEDFARELSRLNAGDNIPLQTDYFTSFGLNALDLRLFSAASATTWKPSEDSGQRDRVRAEQATSRLRAMVSQGQERLRLRRAEREKELQRRALAEQEKLQRPFDALMDVLETHIPSNNVELVPAIVKVTFDQEASKSQPHLPAPPSTGKNARKPDPDAATSVIPHIAEGAPVLLCLSYQEAHTARAAVSTAMAASEAQARMRSRNAAAAVQKQLVGVLQKLNTNAGDSIKYLDNGHSKAKRNASKNVADTGEEHGLVNISLPGAARWVWVVSVDTSLDAEGTPNLQQGFIPSTYIRVVNRYKLPVVNPATIIEDE
jgi:hypothetical protein